METLNIMESQSIAITQSEVDQFIAATRSEYVTGVPPTFLTLYRHEEFALLNELKVDWRFLLHAEQEYEYLDSIPLDKTPKARARVLDYKERKRQNETMKFIKIETDFVVDETLIAKGRSTFVVREPLETK